MFASDWRNPADSIDINSDGFVTPLDALLVINDLNTKLARALPAVKPADESFIDASGDQFVSPIDALLIINELNQGIVGKRRLTEGPKLASDANIVVTAGANTGNRTLRVQLDSVFDTADTSSAVEDTLAVYVVDPNTKATLLDRGTPGTAIFDLAGKHADFTPGLVRWDGSVLEIDLSSLPASSTAQVNFQLINSDGDAGSHVTITPLSNVYDPAGNENVQAQARRSPLTAGPAIDASGLSAKPDVDVAIDNVRYDKQTGLYAADLHLVNRGPAIGTQAVVAFPGLPSGVTLKDAAGTTSTGVPYLNLQPTIPDGGLATGESSQNVLVQFAVANQTRFALKPQVLAGANRAPSLAAVADSVVQPGGALRIPLQATDPDGDRLTYSIVGSPKLPTGELNADGTLIFRPQPDELGSYVFQVQASDGALSSLQTVKVNVVADPLTTTRVSGTVLRTDGTPLSNTVVSIANIQALTGTDGSFLLDLGTGPPVTDTLKVRGDLRPGPDLYPFIAEKLPLMLEHPLLKGVNNVIDRPIYLPILDIANGKTVDPSKDTVVTTAAIPGTSVTVPAGSLMNQQGSPFTGVLSITEVPPDLTPAALPTTLVPDLVVTIQPGDMVFTTPAPMTFPNRAHYLPGALLDLWSINPVTGVFDDVGDMRVSADGSSIETISGGVRNSSWHFVAPPPPVPSPPSTNPANPDPSCDDCPGGSAGNSNVELHSGAEMETHDLAPYVSQGVSRSWQLTYDSMRADPRPIVHFGFENTQPFPNLTLVGNVELQRDDFSYQVPGLTSSQFGLDPGDNIWAINPDHPDADVALQADLSNAPSGHYIAHIKSGLLQFDGQRYAGTLVEDSVDVLHVNTIASQFGSGWGLSGLKELVENGDGSVLMIDGDGSELLFQPPSVPGGDYVSPPGQFGVLTQQAGQTFRWVSTDKTVSLFNALGKLVSMTDRNGRATTFTYDPQGRLTKITDPVGLETTFTINGEGRVSKITDPTGRETQLVYDAAGNLQRITDPDTTFRTWAYDAKHHMTGETDKRSISETTVYDFAGRVSQAILKDGTVKNFTPLQVRNLLPPNATIDPLAPPLSGTISNVGAEVADENGAVTTYTLDRAGQIVSARDSEGPLPSYQRNDENQITRTTDALGRITLREYDSRGNLISLRDEQSGGSDILGAITSAGERDVFTFHADFGQRFYYDALPSANDDLRVTLFSPSGQTIFFDNDESDHGPITLVEAGTYRLEISGNNAATGDFAFRLFSPPLNVAPLTLGAEVSGNLTVPGQVDQFTFTGTTGQRIYYDGLPSANDDLLVNLIGPSGQQILFDNDDANRGPFVLAESGQYRLSIFGNRDALGDYHFRLMNTQVTTSPLTLNAETSGSIDFPGDADVYTFNVTSGQRLYYDGLPSAADDLLVTIVTPSGQQILFDNDDANRGPFAIGEPGTYRLTIFGNNDATGDYHFRLMNTTVTTTPLALNTEVAQSIDNPGDLDVYTFTGTVGQRLFYDGLPGGADNLLVTIVSPTGQQILFDSDKADRGDLVLNEAGTYRVNIFGNQDAVGDYHFRLLDTTVTTAPLVLGSDVTGTIDVAGNVDVYTFNGTVGQLVYYDGLSSAADDLLVTLVSPTGQQYLFDADENNRGPFLLAENGTYRLSLFGNRDAIGDYHFRLLDLAGTPLTLGAPVTGTINPGDGVIAYSFAGTKGQHLTFDSQQPGNANWALFDAAGLQIAGNVGIGTDFTAVLAADGTYKLLLFGGNPAAAVPYNFQVNATTDAPVTPSGFGERHQGSIAAGDTETINIVGAAGTYVVFKERSVNKSTALRAELRGPGNEQVFFSDDMTDRGPVLLPASGAYTLTVRGDTAASTGNFDVTLLSFDQGQALNLATDTPIDLAPLETQVFKFTAVAGQPFFYDGLQTDFSNVVADLYAPSGNQIFHINSDDAFGPRRLPVAGVYYLVISNATAAAQTAKFRILKPTFAQQNITVGDTVTDQLVDSGDQRDYVFTGAVGQHIFYDSLQNDFGNGQRAELVSPSGRTLFSTNQDDNNGPYTLTEAGSYHLLMTGDGDHFGTFSFHLLQSGFTTDAINIGDTLNGNLAQPGDRKQYTFSATAGQRIFYDGLQTDFGNGQRVQLLSPSGQTLFNGNQDDNVGPFILSESGTYRVLMSGDGDRTGTFSARILSPSFVSQPLTIGQTVSDQLANPGDEKDYTFTGTVGQRIYYDSLQNDFGNGQRVQLISPSGQQIFNGNQDDNNGPYELTEAGQYHLLFSGDGDRTGTYSFRLLQPVLTTQSLAFGNTISGSLASPGDRAVYIFVADAGQKLFYDGLENDFSGGQRVQIISPTGELKLNAHQDDNSGLITLTDAGVYRLVLSSDSDQTGSFKFRLLDATGSTTIPLDAVFPDKVTPGRGENVYRFPGTEGQQLYFDAQSGTGLGWTLFAENGSSLFSNGFSDAQVTLPRTGTYFLQVASNVATDAPFQFRIVTPNTNTQTLALDTIVSGALQELGQVDVYTFNGALGQRLIYDSLQNDFANIGYQLVSPSGAVLASKNTDDESSPALVLPETGQWQLRISAGNDVTGSYRFRLRNAESATPLALGVPASGSLSPGFSTQVYRLDGSAGQRLQFSYTGTIGYTWDLLNPGGSCVVCGQTPGTATTVGLPSSGSYLLVLRGTDPAVDHNFQVTVTDKSDAPVAAANLPLLQSGNLNPSQETTFNFTANAGTTLFFDALEGDNDTAVAELRDPQGNLVFSQSASNDFGPFNLPRSGTYSLKLRNSSAGAAADFNFRLLRTSDMQTVLPGAQIVGTLPGDGTTGAYVVNAVAGQRLVLDARSPTAGALRYRLVGPEGQTVFDVTTDIGAPPVTITRTGQYTLYVGGSQTAAKNIAFRLTDVLSINPTPLDTLITDSLNAGYEGDVFRFSGKTGERLVLRTTSPVFNARGNLYGPGNQFLSNIVIGLTQDVTLPSDGEYVFVVDGDAPATQSYTLTFSKGGIEEQAVTLKTSPGTAPGKKTFSYDSTFNQLTGSVDELGGQTVITLDPATGNRLTETRIIGAAGGGDDLTTTYTYTAHGLIDTMTDPLGRVTDYDYDSRDRVTQVRHAVGTPVQTSEHFEYDTAGNVTAYIDPNGNRTEYQYDSLNRMTRMTEADPDGAGPLTSPVTQYVYDADGNLLSLTDARGNQWQYTYDNRDRRLTMTDPQGGVTRFAYDLAGNIVAITDALGRVTRYEFDDRNRPIRKIDPAGGVTQLAYDAEGQLISKTDELGRQWQMAYDPRGHVISQRDPLGNAETWTYDAVDNMVAHQDRNGHTEAMQYDEAYRQTTHTDALGGVRTLRYDLAGNVISTTDELQRTWNYSYDALNRITQSVDPLGHTTSWTYDAVGNELSETDGLGHATVRQYDALNRLISIQEPGGSLTKFAYDAEDNLVQLTDPSNNVTTRTYDKLNRRLTDTDALGHTRTNTYDAVGNIITAVDRDNRRRDFTYDQLERMTAEKWLAADNSVVRTISYSYDAADQLTGASDPGAAYQFSYDAAGRISTLGNSGTPGVTAVTFQYAYDAFGNLLRRDDVIGGQTVATTANTYDPLNRLTRVTQSGTQAAAKRVDMAYDAASQMTSMARFADLAGTQAVASSTYTYDAAGRLSNLAHAHGATPINTYAWTFDAADRIVQQTSIDGVTNYSYDTRDELTGADHSFQTDETYNYDLSGNRTGGSVQIAAANQLTADGKYTYVYDNEGNLIQRTETATGKVTRYEWDYRNRLTRVTTETNTGQLTSEALFVYDPFDQRISSTIDADGAGAQPPTVDRYIYSGDQVALVLSGSGTVLRRTMYGAAVDQLLAEEHADGTVLWPLADQLESVRDVVDSSGTVVNHIRYDSFGNVTSETNPAIDLLAGYAGRELDEATGLMYFRARYYDPATGRFLSRDPLGYATKDPNLYRYVGNRVTGETDPMGTGSYQDDWQRYSDYVGDRGVWNRPPDFPKPTPPPPPPPPPTTPKPPDDGKPKNPPKHPEKPKDKPKVPPNNPPPNCPPGPQPPTPPKPPKPPTPPDTPIAPPLKPVRDVLRRADKWLENNLPKDLLPKVNEDLKRALEAYKWLKNVEDAFWFL